jgi:hypothetical protein
VKGDYDSGDILSEQASKADIVVRMFHLPNSSLEPKSRKTYQDRLYYDQPILGQDIKSKRHNLCILTPTLDHLPPSIAC